MIKTAASSPRPSTKRGTDTKKRVKTVAPSTKLSQLESLLRRPEGATITQLVSALDWQAHSVRGAISGSLKKKQGLNVTSEKGDGKLTVYRIVS
jgi:Protein of unknown function (DUF3489)